MAAWKKVAPTLHRSTCKQIPQYSNIFVIDPRTHYRIAGFSVWLNFSSAQKIGIFVSLIFVFCARTYTTPLRTHAGRAEKYSF